MKDIIEKQLKYKPKFKTLPKLWLVFSLTIDLAQNHSLHSAQNKLTPHPKAGYATLQTKEGLNAIAKPTIRLGSASR